MIIQDGEFVWNAELQGLILSSFFWGYLVTQVPGGWMSEKFGSKLVWGWFMFATIIASFFMPIAARISPILFIILRIIQGLGEVCWIHIICNIFFNFLIYYIISVALSTLMFIPSQQFNRIVLANIYCD